MFCFAIGVVTDQGDIRPENQDSVLYLTNKEGDPTMALFAVADGMGGLSYGAQVSQYITAQFERWWYEDFMRMLADGMDKEEDIRELLEQEIWDINQAVLEFKSRMQCRSGSTLSLLLFYGNRYFIENIGDSRIYRMRHGSLLQLTRDQSLAEKMVREHHMTKEEARHSKMQNVLTMCIGMFSVPQSSYDSGVLLPGDCFLICSDGLYHPLSQEQMENVLAESGLTAQEKADWLRRLIGSGNAKDNVSVIVVETEQKGSAERLHEY